MRTHYIISSLFCAVLSLASLTACSDDDSVAAYAAIENTSTAFSGDFNAADYPVTVRSNRPWQVKLISSAPGASVSDTSWVRPFPAEGDKDGIFHLIVKENTGFEARSAKYALVVDGSEYPVAITVDQAAAVPSITVGNGKDSVNAPAAGGAITLAVKANVPDWTCSVDEESASWLRLDSIGHDATVYLTAQKNLDVARTGTLHFTSASQPSANHDVHIVQASAGVIIKEDFSWLHYGTDITYNTDGQVRVDYWTDAEKAHGWTSTPVAESSNQPLLYGCLGFVKLGKTNFAGDLISPALTALEGQTANVTVTFKACGYVSAGGTLDDNDLYVSVIGPGKVSVSKFTIDNYPNSTKLEHGANYNVWAPAIAERTFTVTGATKDTRIKFMAGQSYSLKGVGKGKNRIFIDDVTVKVAE